MSINSEVFDYEVKKMVYVKKETKIIKKRVEHKSGYQ